MLLSRIIPHLDVVRHQLTGDPDVTFVTRDSRLDKAGSLFCAIQGDNFDGHTVIGTMTAASVVICERWVAPVDGVSLIVVTNSREALGVVAALLAGGPSHQVRLVGITGTNGKTTISTLVDNALNAVAIASGRIGTTGTFVKGVPYPSSLTTPESPELQKTLARMVAENVEVACLEVSSIGLDQRRLAGCEFGIAVFTNISRDHLDYHLTMEAYVEAKAQLFRRYLRPKDGLPRALLCADDARHQLLGAPDDHWTYGFSERADVRITAVQSGVDTMDLSFTTPVGPISLSSTMLGTHNAQNLAGALAIGLLLGVPGQAFADALGQSPAVRGRLERVPNTLGVLLVVDYAHTPDALDVVLTSLQAITTGRLIVVFGCGGDRDKGKRSVMGRVADSLADVVVVTNDNPRFESPMVIAQAICAGITGPVKVELDRAAAVSWAIGESRAGDTVLVAGKGHETTQVVNDTVTDMDDRVLIARALERK